MEYYQRLENEKQQALQKTVDKHFDNKRELHPLSFQQKMKLLQIRKMRESLKKPVQENSPNSPVVDDFSMEELLETTSDISDKPVKRLGKRARLDSATESDTTVGRKVLRFSASI